MGDAPHDTAEQPWRTAIDSTERQLERGRLRTCTPPVRGSPMPRWCNYRIPCCGQVPGVNRKAGVTRESWDPALIPPSG